MKFERDKDGTLYKDIQDIEGDVIRVKFNNDGCVHIDTEGYTYITLEYSKLEELMCMIGDAEELYEEEFNKENK